MCILADRTGENQAAGREKLAMRLGDIDQRLLTVLTWRCRAGLEDQLASILGTTVSCLRQATAKLKRERLVSSRDVTAVSYELERPLAAFARGEQIPDFGALQWELQRRWRNAARRPARALWATRFATRLVGGVGGRLRQPLQLQHDLGVTEIYARRTLRPKETWISEDVYRSLWKQGDMGKVPDALLVDPEGRLLRAVEFGGRYSRQRLEDFHTFWATRLPYEIW
jgi:hypothetical protein